MVILENIDIDKAILQNIDIDKISNRFKFGISNRASHITLGARETQAKCAILRAGSRSLEPLIKVTFGWSGMCTCAVCTISGWTLLSWEHNTLGSTYLLYSSSMFENPDRLSPIIPVTRQRGPIYLLLWLIERKWLGGKLAFKVRNGSGSVCGTRRQISWLRQINPNETRNWRHSESLPDFCICIRICPSICLFI